jgi:putative serine protease PepD
VDCKGKLIGVNTAIATVPNANGEAGGGSVGLGFAIPVDMAYPIAQQLIKDGKATHPSIGVQVEQISATAAQAAGLPRGLRVAAVTKAGPSAKAGIVVGDVITEVNGDAARVPDQIIVAQLASRSGQPVKLTYVRDGATKEVSITPTNTGP